VWPTSSDNRIQDVCNMFLEWLIIALCGQHLQRTTFRMYVTCFWNGW